MTDFQLGSLLVGAAIIAAVYGFNFWQEYRYRKTASQPFSPRQGVDRAPSPEGASRIEPVLSAHAREPEVVLAADDDAVSESEPFRQADERVFLNPELYFIAEVQAREAILAADIPVFSAPKPLHIIGKVREGNWKSVSQHANAAYIALGVGLQLANRAGPVNHAQLAQFCKEVQAFADAANATVTFPLRTPKLEAACKLDAFCAEVDVLIGVNIVPLRLPMRVETLKTQCEAIGLATQSHTVWTMHDENGQLLFSLKNQDQTPFLTTTTGVTLFLDVPQAPAGLATFTRLTQVANDLAHTLEGTVVDDRGKALTEDGVARIEAQLSRLYAAMTARGIEPGSFTARRLFS